MIPLKVAIVEDNELFRCELNQVLSEIDSLDIIYSSSDGNELVKQLSEIKPDLFILDISLPEISGIELAEIARRKLPGAEIIFITSYDDYRKEAFNLYAIDYISKPLDIARLKQTIGKIKNKNDAGEEIIEVALTNDRKIFLKLREINFIEAKGKNARVSTESANFLVQNSFKELAETLNSNAFFTQTSRSYMVNINKIEAVEKYNRTSLYITFKNSREKAFLSKSFYEKFRKELKKL